MISGVRASSMRMLSTSSTIAKWCIASGRWTTVPSGNVSSRMRPPCWTFSSSDCAMLSRR